MKRKGGNIKTMNHTDEVNVDAVHVVVVDEDDHAMPCYSRWSRTKTVTHPSTNWARCRVTSMIETNTTAMLNCHH